jgi:hypothetical protein
LAPFGPTVSDKIFLTLAEENLITYLGVIAPFFFHQNFSNFCPLFQKL